MACTQINPGHTMVISSRCITGCFYSPGGYLECLRDILGSRKMTTAMRDVHGTCGHTSGQWSAAAILCGYFPKSINGRNVQTLTRVFCTPLFGRSNPVMRPFVFSVLVFLASLFSAQAQEATWPGNLVLATEHYPPFSLVDGTGFEDLVAKEVFGRLGISVSFNILPSERVLSRANSGQDDGMLARVGGMSDKYPNLVQFMEPALIREFVVFGREKVEISGWESLKPYRVALLTGWKIFERNITGTASLTKVKYVDQLFAMLDAGRVDLIAYAKLSGIYHANSQGYDGIHPLEAPLATRESFFYLNKKHKNLIAPASAALREMKADGAYQKIFDETIGLLMIDEPIP